MKKTTFTALSKTLALAASVRKPMPPPSRPFKGKREKRNDWKRMAD
jgi:hypothetical protein